MSPFEKSVQKSRCGSIIAWSNELDSYLEAFLKHHFQTQSVPCGDLALMLLSCLVITTAN